MKKHYETHVEDTDKLISVAGPVLDYKSWYEQYRKLMEEQAQRKYGLYTPTSEGDDDFPSISGMIARYSALGLTNEQMATNPVWVDKTGNGRDLQLKNFSWKGMSGVGGYGDENYQTFYKFTLDDYVFIATPPGVKHMNFTFRVTGLQPGNKLTLAFLEQRILSTVHGTKMAYILLMLILLRQGNQHTFITDMAQPEESLRLKFFLSTLVHLSLMV